MLPKSDFHHPRGAILGVLGAILSVGAICGTPFISLVADRHGRRMGIFTGSLIMACGGILQGCSQNRKYPLTIIGYLKISSKFYKNVGHSRSSELTEIAA
jgi:MFS family permease